MMTTSPTAYTSGTTMASPMITSVAAPTTMAAPMRTMSSMYSTSTSMPTTTFAAPTTMTVAAPPTMASFTAGTGGVRYIQQPAASPYPYGQQVQIIQPGMPFQQGFQQVQPYQQIQPVMPIQPVQPVQPQVMDIKQMLLLKQLFTQADRNQSGTMDANELMSISAQIGLEPALVNQYMAQYDLNRDGTLSWPEFVACFAAAIQKKPVSPPKPQPMLPSMPSQDGKFVDPQFPPDQNSLFSSTNPQMDHVQDILQQTGNGSAVQWIRAAELCPNGELFCNIHPNDITQGILGDCWFLAGLATMAEHPNLILDMFPNQKTVSPDGKYQVRFYNSTTRCYEEVTIDDFIPCGPDGKPLFCKPADNEMWVLLAEKACAKWFGSYVRMAGAYAMLPFLLLTDCGACIAYSQQQVAQGQYNPTAFNVVQATITDPHDRMTVALQPPPGVPPVASADELWQKLMQSDDANHVMACWTMKDPPTQTGVGMSGEAIASDGIVKGHAYSLIAVDEYQADGQNWQVVQIRNPWGANPNAEWNGALSDKWPEWPKYPELHKKMNMTTADLDGMFWMPWANFLDRYSDVGFAPVIHNIPKLGKVEREIPKGSSGGRRGKKKGLFSGLSGGSRGLDAPKPAQ